MSMTRILVVEDDIDFYEELEELLSTRGYQVECVRTLYQFQQIADLKIFDIIVVDLNLPDGDGTDIIRMIREQSSSGVIVVSGKTDQTHKVLALEIGADDYVEKPLSSLEFVARLRRLIRRSEVTAKPESNDNFDNVIAYKNWVTDIQMRTVTNTNGELVELTKLEFDLWVVFLKNQGAVLSRDRLIYLLRGQSWAGSDRSIDGLLSRLRKKLIDDKDCVRFNTVHGVGYSLEKCAFA